MKILKIKTSKIISVLCLIATCMPLPGSAQHFGHGGGGGGGFRGGGGGGGGAHMGGGGEHMGGGGAPVRMGGGEGGGYRGGGVVEHPATINGGSRNYGNHVFGGGGRSDRPVINMHGNDNAFHGGGGFHSYAYAYHPYHPYYWGARWHPFGYFMGALTADAIMLSIAGQAYYYDDGVYYSSYNGGYQAVAPPTGATVSYLPAGFETVPMGDDTYYYYGGVFYVSQGGSYAVVPAPVGAIVTQIPEGATQQNINGQNYLLYNNAYFVPISANGQDAYQVVQVS